MSIDGRKTGWLDDLMHSRVREALVHTLARYRLICPTYCLMPDHGHFVIGGLSPNSDQRKAIRFFRKEWNRQLSRLDGEFVLQKQPYDHALTEREIQRDAFENVSGYVLENPVRAGFVERLGNWEFLGAVATGYPDLDPRASVFWEKLWKIYQLSRDDGT